MTKGGHLHLRYYPTMWAKVVVTVIDQLSGAKKKLKMDKTKMGKMGLWAVSESKTCISVKCRRWEKALGNTIQFSNYHILNLASLRTTTSPFAVF